MIILLIPLLTAVLWNILRRRYRYLSNDDLLPSEEDSDLEFRVVKSLGEKDLAGLKEAFRGGPDVHWIYNEGAPLNEKDSAALAEQVSYEFDFVARLSQSYGHIIRCGDKKTGEYLGCICLIPPVSAYLHSIYLVATGLIQGRPPKVVMENPERRARFFALGDTTKHHHQVMDGKPHWYVLTLGVSPQAQGKGVGGKLLKQARFLAAKEGLPLYLECHDDNVKYYSTRGFVRERLYLLQPDGMAPESAYPYNSMVLHADTHSTI